jgi:leucyl aminopeptidase
MPSDMPPDMPSATHPAIVTTAAGRRPVPITFVSSKAWLDVRLSLSPEGRRFAEANAFAAKPGQCVLIPQADGSASQVLFGCEAADDANHDRFRAGQLPALLPPGLYAFAQPVPDARLAALAFALGSYTFSRYRKNELRQVQLLCPDGIDGDLLGVITEATGFARDLINTPANDMGPDQLEAAARQLAQTCGAEIGSIEGDDLLRNNLPLIHAVGKGSVRAPRLIDLRWGQAQHPKVTLVGKGVCFDSGGLDLKPESAMQLMKKDMAGAATVLALAQMIMRRNLKIRLRVLIPAVENAVSGNAFRPLDIYPSRKGLSVEIGNTDAEGRLVLADALALADEERPDLLIDLGTLTGAARVALGPDLPPFYTQDDTLAADLARCAASENDPLWRMPLWAPYASWLDSRVADINNVASGGHAGSIVCALFLQRFVTHARSWLHVDIFGWTVKSAPGRPEGGECQAARALFALLAERHG